MDAPDHSGAGEFGGGHGHDGGSHGGGFGGHGVFGGHGHGGHVGHVGPGGVHGQLGHDAHQGGGQGFLIDAAPTTWLPVGIDPGWKYVAETYAHARTFGYAVGVDSCVPRGTPITAKMAEVIALEAAKKYGGVQALSPYKTGLLYEHPSFSALAAPAEGAPQGRFVNMPGIARSLHTIELLAWPHRACNVKDKVAEVLTSLGLARLDLRRTSSLPDIEKPTEEKLLSANPFAGVNDGLNPANGWFRSHSGDVPKGKTTIWRRFWQVKGCFDGIFQPKDKDLSGTFIVEFGCTWYFAKTGDYETRVAFSIYGAPYVPAQHQTWKWNLIKKHREAAEKAAKTVFSFIDGLPKPTEAIRERQRINLEMMEPEVLPARDPFEVTAPVIVAADTGNRAGDPPGPEADERR
jgi:hypothetical protein